MSGLEVAMLRFHPPERGLNAPWAKRSPRKALTFHHKEVDGSCSGEDQQRKTDADEQSLQCARLFGVRCDNRR